MDKNPAHRPLKYKTLEELQKAVDEYFEYCDNRLVNGWDDKTHTQFAYISPEPYTMSGLAYALDLSRQGLLDYSNRDQFLDTIKKAREKVETDVERRLMEGKATTGAIFNLKNNFNWRDEQHTDVTSGGKPIPLLSSLDVHNNDSSKEAEEAK